MAFTPTRQSDSLWPSPGLPIINPETGEMDQIWQSFFYGLYNRSGGSINILVADLQQQVEQNTFEVNVSISQSTVALQNSQEAKTDAAAASTTAILAQSTANSTANALSSRLVRTNNLGDVSNISASRSNLGLNSFFITQTFDTVPNGLTRYIPITLNCSLLTNFTGSIIYCGTFSTNDVNFTIKYIRNNVSTIIGTIGLIHSGNFPVFNGIPTQLQIGDILTITCPSPADATFANVGISMLLNIS